MARQEVAAARSIGATQDVVRGVVVGTVIGEALLNALRLMARQSVSIELPEPDADAPDR